MTPKDPQAEAFKQANEALNNAKVPTEDRQVMDADDPRVFNPLATQIDIRETVDGILENFRVRTLEKQDKGNKRDATKTLLALLQAREQQLLTELLGEAKEYEKWVGGNQATGRAITVRAVPVSVIEAKLKQTKGEAE